jgi:chitinase
LKNGSIEQASKLVPHFGLVHFLLMQLGARISSWLPLWVMLLAIGCLASIGRADLWVTAYYAGWNQNYLTPANVDFGAVSHVIHFSVVPNSNGLLNTNVNGLTPAYSSSLVAAAHAAGKKALICVGGADSQTGFQGATTAANLSPFISRLITYMSVYNYDGIDLDWEPLPATDANQFTNLVNGLRAALNGFSPSKLLTVAAAAYPPSGDPPAGQYNMFASLQSQFDQINIMTYDLAGPYPGWVTWFNAPIYDGGYHFPSTGGLILSGDGAVTNFLSHGVAPGKLGIGMAFYGVVWAGGAGTSTGGAALPRQTWTSAPSTQPNHLLRLDVHVLSIEPLPLG